MVPSVNHFSMNIGKRFWPSDNTDINRMFPGYKEGETTQRIAAGVFENIKDYSFKAPFGHSSTHCIQRIHSEWFLRCSVMLRISTFIGQFFSHFLQLIHLSGSSLIWKRAKRLAGFRKTVTGQIYLQKARLSLQIKASAMPTT